MRTWYTLGRPDSTYTYYKDGKLKMVSNKQYRRSYYPDGKLEEDMTLGEGPATAYYPNGKKKYQANYSRYAVNGEWKAWNENGVLVIHAWADHFTDTLEYVYSNKGKKLAETDTAYDAQIKRYMPAMMYRKTMPTDRFWDQEGDDSQVAPAVYDIEQDHRIDTKTTEVFSFAEEMPKFPGEKGTFQDYLRKNMVYPQTERDAGKQGTVYIKFNVQKDGSITDVKEAKGVAGAPGLTKEAIRLISAMPNWIPGKMNGHPVPISMNLPVRFTLD
jgi:TonB family protein